VTTVSSPGREGTLARGVSAEHNIASHLPRIARISPERIAVRAPVGSRKSSGARRGEPSRADDGSLFGPGGPGNASHSSRVFAKRTAWAGLSFAELDERCDAIAHGLAARGLVPGDRVALFVRPGFDLVAITFALFKLGAVPVLVDPGMGQRALVSCVARTKPRAFIGVPAAQVLRALHRRELASIEISVTVGPRWFAGATTLSDIVRGSYGRFEARAVRPDDEAAVLFTSGSTGPAKGVVYTHANFAAQVRVLRELYGLRPGEIDLSCFPLFALFSVALEMTAVFPVMDPSHPGRCDPERIAEAILEHGATNTFGSPAIWRRVVPWCIERGVRFPTLERALIAGASVPLDLVEGFHGVLAGEADVHTPYGATECLPVSSIHGRALCADLRARSESGAGTCVGRAAPGIEIALIAIQDEPIREWSDARVVRAGDRAREIGEICVRGEVVTREYKFDERATALSKIRDGETLWHRMGDVGYFDDEGLLWFCGRKAHRIETGRATVLPVPAENVFNLHPRVRHSALIGIGPRGRERPALVVEPEAKAMPKNALERSTFTRELEDLARERGRAPEHMALPDIDTVLYRRTFPMDVRHNAKIQREKLKAWAQGERP
jgi:acyl-CoA synthetase (AMP-forming)/AMP-acid ligase II